MSGNGEWKELYQSEIKRPPEPYKGKEKRCSRIPLSQESENLLRALDGRIKSSCRDTCFLSPSNQSVVNHGIGALSELGDGKPANGIDLVRDQSKRLRDDYSLWDSIKSKALSTIVVLIVGGIMGLIISGFMQRMK